MVKRRTVLVLGGGGGQLPLLGRLNQAGIRIILQDRDESCAGRYLSDEFIRHDTCDSRAASEAARRFRVDGVLTAGTDQPVLAAARAASARGCPSLIDSETALGVTDKERMKGILVEAGIPVPRYRILSPTDGPGILDGLNPPRVIKPVDSQGQRGVVKLEDVLDFPAFRDESLRWSARGRLIAEEYHSNREVTVSGWVHEGKTEIWAVTDRVTREYPPHIGLCLAHRYPSTYAAGRMEEIEQTTLRCIRALGIGNGPIYFQFLIPADSGKEILVNETAARLGGAYEETSLPPVCGRDPLELLISGALEGRADPDENRFRIDIRAGAFSVPLMFCRPGRIAALSGAREARAVPGVTAFSFLLRERTLINPPRNSVQRAAYMVVHGKEPSGVNRILKKACSRLKIRDERGRQLLRNTLGYSRAPH